MAKVVGQFVFVMNPVNFDWKAEQKREAEWLESLKGSLRRARNADSGRGNFKTSLIGEVLRWQRGDGYAQYIITKEKPFCLAHLHIGDGYQVEPETIRGFRLSDAKAQVKQNAKLKAIFS